MKSFGCEKQERRGGLQVWRLVEATRVPECSQQSTEFKLFLSLLLYFSSELIIRDGIIGKARNIRTTFDHNLLSGITIVVYKLVPYNKRYTIQLICVSWLRPHKQIFVIHFFHLFLPLFKCNQRFTLQCNCENTLDRQCLNLYCFMIEKQLLGRT